MTLRKFLEKGATATPSSTFHLRARDILAALEDAEAEVSQAGRVPRGRLRINCVSGFAFHELANALPTFVARYPEVRIEMAVTDRVVDLLTENAVVGIRSGVVTDPNLVTRRIAELLMIFAGWIAFADVRDATWRS